MTAREPQLPVFGAGEVWIVGAGPGDPGLLTLLAYHALNGADIVLHDALVAPAILALAPNSARCVAVGKRKGRPSSVQLRINERLIREARAGKRVLRLKGGDPFVFGRGGEEVLALRAAGVPCRIVPGVSAGTAAPALAGIPVTHRGVARSVAFLTGHGVGGELPRDLDLEALARGAETLVIFMAATRFAPVAERLIAAGRGSEEPLAFIAAAGTPEQVRTVTTLGRAMLEAPTFSEGAPVLVVLGSVVALAELCMPVMSGSASGSEGRTAADPPSTRRVS